MVKVEGRTCRLLEVNASVFWGREHVLLGVEVWSNNYFSRADQWWITCQSEQVGAVPMSIALSMNFCCHFFSGGLNSAFPFFSSLKQLHVYPFYLTPRFNFSSQSRPHHYVGCVGLFSGLNRAGAGYWPTTEIELTAWLSFSLGFKAF